jgi:hypothetical protein
MSAWLGRPNLIDQKNLTFKFPNLRLDQSTTEPNLLSPFAHMALQANLGRRVATAMGNAHSKADLSATQVLAIQSECEKFITELPAIFRIKDPDTSLDKAHTYFVFQRYQMHCVIYLTMLDFLKPYLTRERRDQITDQDDEFREKGTVIALRLLKVARQLFDHEFPINAKFHGKYALRILLRHGANFLIVSTPSEKLQTLSLFLVSLQQTLTTLPCL